MTEAEALRVLGLQVGGRKASDSDVRIDSETIRNAFSAQMQMLRGARSEADTARERQRIDRALTLTLLARDRLLPADSRAFAPTQEIPRVERPRTAPYALAVLLIGVIMVAVGLLPESVQDGVAVVADPAPPPAAAESLQLSRALLDDVRFRLQEQWRQTSPLRLPAATDLHAVNLPALPSGWRWQGQRDGAFAAIEGSSGNWLLAAPLLEDGSLYWACFSARPGYAGCQVLPGDAIVERRLPRGQVGARLLAEALARLPDAERQEGWSPQRWYRQALQQGEPEAALALADQAMAAARPAFEVEGWLSQAVDLFEQRQAFPEAIAALVRLVDLRLVAGRPHAETLAWLERCEALRSQQPLVCPEASSIGRQLERRADSPQHWDDARWWYQRGIESEQAAGLEGMVHLLALGRAGTPQRRRALMLLEEAAESWSDYSMRQAGIVAADLVRIWSRGWSVEADQGEASWWASQGARLGNVGAALHLAAAFALGLGTARDLDRAREVVRVYADHAPVFEVAFHREVARRLQSGEGLEADEDAAAAWYRRAFELCQQLAAAGDDDARFDLAGMYFSGHGVDRDLGEAARRYAELLEVSPQAAGNMLAWIQATAPDAALRDGRRALELARAVVSAAPTPTFLDTLAAALAETGAFRDAVAIQQQALDLLEAGALPFAGGADVVDRRERLALRMAHYRQRRPWRDDGLG
ncbi:MAG: hypothetical protein JJT88_02505 [Gammaproteobacteria bacterium]|nr:hypothetical protein [Gammaproteobacteria bacterium]